MIYRPKSPKDLTKEQQGQKLQWDEEYEQAVQALDGPFYSKKHTVGVTAQEEADHTAARSLLWPAERARRIAAGMYREYDELAEKKAKRDELNAEIAELERL